MALIKLTLSEMSNVKSQISSLAERTESNGTAVARIASNLDMEVKARQNIEEQLQKIKNDLNKQSQKLTAYSNVLNDVMNQFVSADSKKKTNIDAVSFEKNTTVVAAGMVGAMLKNTLNGWVSKEQLDKVNKNAGKNTTTKKTDVSNLKKFVNWSKNKAKKAAKSLKKRYGNVVQKGKNCVSNVGKKINKVKNWYVENKEKINAYGKAAWKIGKGVIKIAGAVAVLAGTAGGSAPLAIMDIITAGNDIINGASDIVYASNEQYDMVGKTNFLKDKLVENGGIIGEQLGNKELGEQFGDIVYKGVDLVTFLDGADKMLKSLGKANMIATGKVGSAFIFGKTSFDDIKDKSFMKIMYDAAKSIYKTGEKAYSLGKSLV